MTTTDATDRQVHGVTQHGGEVVRYDRAGKWYLEYPDRRKHITVKEAAAYLVDDGATWFAGRYGGRLLDAKVEQLHVAREQARARLNP